MFAVVSVIGAGASPGRSTSSNPNEPAVVVDGPAYQFPITVVPDGIGPP